MMLSFSPRCVQALGALSAGLALMLGLVIASPVLAEPRVALVIGNSAYTGDLPALANPANDARLMAKTLKSVGFDVVETEDASADQIKQAIASFSKKLSAAGSEGTGLFFYAGHGVQVAGENYMIPVDAKLEREADVTLQAVAASTVLQQMDFAGSAVNIIILDACRNNPLPSSARSASRGLAEIKTTPRGSFIAYSTAPGSTAADGDGVNSPYTKALAETITQPGLSIADVFQEVRTKVLASTGNTQTPWDSSSLTGRFYFKAPDPAQVAAVAPPPAKAAPTADDYETTYWASVKDSNDPEDFEAYLNKYPNGPNAEYAQLKIDKLKGNTKVASADAPADARNGLQPLKPAEPAGQAVAKPAGMSFIAQSQTVYAKSGGQVRAEPNAKAELVDKLQANTAVTASGISTDGKWWRVALADGRTGFMHDSVVTEQPAQPKQDLAAAAPAQPQTLGAEAFEPVSATPAPAPEQNDAASQIFQGLVQYGAQQAGINLPQVPVQPAPSQQTGSSLSFDEIYETIEVRAGADILNAAGGQPVYQVRQAGPLLATALSSDGRWYRVSLPTGGEGYVAKQSVIK